MIFEKESILDLNEENVKKIFTYCLATPDTNPNDIIIGSFLGEGVNLSIPIPSINFSKTRIMETTRSIFYLLGQLECVHKNSPFAEISDGIKKYDGSNWTTENFAVFSLYYLGCTSVCFPKFKPHRGSNSISARLGEIPSLSPTVSPEDPFFEEWIKKEEEKTKRLSGML